VARYVGDGAVGVELSDPLATLSGWPSGVVAEMVEGEEGGTLAGRVASMRGGVVAGGRMPGEGARV
jgi:hypothetical protein